MSLIWGESATIDPNVNTSGSVVVGSVVVGSVVVGSVVTGSVVAFPKYCIKLQGNTFCVTKFCLTPLYGI